MFTSSEDAMQSAVFVSRTTAAAELKRHYCRILDVSHDGNPERPNTILVTNDLDPPEWIGCNTKRILEWLGY